MLMCFVTRGSTGKGGDPLACHAFSVVCNCDFLVFKDVCLKSLNTLEKAGLIKMDDGFDLKPTGK